MQIIGISGIYYLVTAEKYENPGKPGTDGYEALKKISEVDQVILCTHSSNFIDMNDYLNIAIITKTSIAEGTKIHSVVEELFEGNAKQNFNMARYFNHDRNEVFFAKKVILVEGGCEKSSFPLLARRLDFFDHRVSIIDCGGKTNLRIFMAVLNEFHIPYLVVHDEDPIPQTKQPEGEDYDPDKYPSMKRIFDENAKITNECDDHYGTVQIISPTYESMIGIGKNNPSKPYSAVKKYSDPDEPIPPPLEDLIKRVYKIPIWNSISKRYEYSPT